MAESTESVLVKNKRFIGALIADVTTQEQHDDQLTITDHPVEKGSPVSDHAYLMPPKVTIKIGWSASSVPKNQELGDAFLGDASEVNLSSIYERLLGMQRRAELISVSTGKRLYQNMLIQSLGETTDVTSEYALNITMTLRQLFIANTQQTSLYVDQQAKPDETAPVADGGVKQPKPVDESFLKGLFG